MLLEYLDIVLQNCSRKYAVKDLKTENNRILYL